MSPNQNKKWNSNSILGVVFFVIFISLFIIFLMFSDQNSTRFVVVREFTKSLFGAGVYIFSTMTSLVLSAYFNLKAKKTIQETGARGGGFNTFLIIILLFIVLTVLGLIGTLLGWQG